jgi:hypothetical protein
MCRTGSGFSVLQRRMSHIPKLKKQSLIFNISLYDRWHGRWFIPPSGTEPGSKLWNQDPACLSTGQSHGGGTPEPFNQWVNQLDALSNSDLLSRFVGMLTDSRSFLSYPRHEYFRRILCTYWAMTWKLVNCPMTWNWSEVWSKIFVITMP